MCTRDSRSTRATAHEDAVKAKQAEIEAKLPILSGLTDRAGDDLVRAVGAALDDGWREEIVAGEAEAAARVDAAIAELDVALQAHTKAKSASAWAQKFETAAALTPGWHRVPDMRYRPGQTATVPVPRSVVNGVSSQNGTLAVPTDIIVAWLRRVTAPPEAPRTTTDDPAVVEILKR